MKISTILLLSIILGITGCLLYAQFSADMGNVWIRTNSEGVKVFRPDFAVHYILEPFKPNMSVWVYPNLWILNSFIWCLVIFLIFLFLYYIFRNKNDFYNSKKYIKEK